MRDKEKMISGLIYDPADKELAEMRQAAHIPVSYTHLRAHET